MEWLRRLRHDGHASQRPVADRNKMLQRRLLNRAADLGKYVVGIRSDEPDRAHDNNQNHSQHNGVFCDVLATLIVPKLL